MIPIPEDPNQIPVLETRSCSFAAAIQYGNCHIIVIVGTALRLLRSNTTRVLPQLVVTILYSGGHHHCILTHLSPASLEYFLGDLSYHYYRLSSTCARAGLPQDFDLYRKQLPNQHQTCHFFAEFIRQFFILPSVTRHVFIASLEHIICVCLRAIDILLAKRRSLYFAS